MMELAQWLRELGLAQYLEVFAANDIDADVLAELSDGDLAIRSLHQDPNLL